MRKKDEGRKKFKIRGFYLLFFSIIFANCFLFFLPALSKKTNSSFGKKSVSIIGLKDNNFIPGKEKGKISLLLFFDPLKTNHKGILAYAQVLYEKYKSRGFKIIGVSNRNKKETEIFKSDYFTFNLIADEDKNIHNKFGISKCCGGTVLIDKEGKTKFAVKQLMNIENLRQITEKNLFGKVNYEFNILRERDIFRLGQKIPGIELVEVYSNKTLGPDDLKSGHHVITFFSSICSTCKTGQRIKTLKKCGQLRRKKKAK